MQTVPAVPYSFTCVDAGVDWITCTARGKASRKSLEAQGEAILKEATAAGVEIKPAAVRDYVGWRCSGVFSGRRSEDSMVVLSSATAARHWSRVAQASTNVSRLDLQVTVWTHGEQPALSRWYYQKLRRQKPSRGRPRSLSLIQTFPHGDTLYVGKRTSDCFGRVYDFSTAHKQGEARTLWRYEVEFKRHLALCHSRALLGAADPRSHTESAVGSWYDRRGLLRTWNSSESPHSEDVWIDEKERDVLLWFRTSLSKTIHRQIKSVGLAAVLEALNLSHLVIPSPRKEDSAYASVTPQTLLRHNRGRVTRAVDNDTVLAKGR